MRVFVAGATGAIGRQLLPLLVKSGHTLTGLTRTAAKTAAIRRAGAEAVVVGVLDAEEIASVVVSQSPDVVVHELTAIPARIDPRRFAEEFAPTNRLRREGTRNLLAAAVAAGSRRIIVQSIAQAYAPVGGWVKVEDDPLYRDAPPVFADVFQAIIDLEAITLAADRIEPVVLRYGSFYGPGTRFAVDGSDAELVRDGRFPIAGRGPLIGRSSTFRTLPARPSGRSTTAPQVSTTLSMTSRPRSRTGFRPTRPRLKRRHRPTSISRAVIMGSTACCSRVAPVTPRRRSSSAGVRFASPGARASAPTWPDRRWPCGLVR